MKKIIIMSALLLSGCAHISLPNFNGSCPHDYPVKGNANSGIYHVPASPYYIQTIAELCFDSPSEARRRGFVSTKR